MNPAETSIATRWNSFDEVFCLTLEGQLERQRLVSCELNEAGLSRFQFIDGIKADSPLVHRMFRLGKVQHFPPCFRCGKIECGCPNNVLIPPQVACFLSYLKIFGQAARSRSNTFLVLEDDIIFQPFTNDQLAPLLSKPRLQSFGFFSEQHPCLLGMGTASPCEKEVFKHQTLKWEKGDGSPSNTCFAFNRRFAELALSEHKCIDTTVDLYIHRILAKKCNNLGLVPRIVFDRSWHEGSVPSTIHPKPHHLEHISDPLKREAEAKRLQRHLKKVKTIPLGIAGIPRGGTGWAAAVATRLGWPIGHEATQEVGVSSWMLAAPTLETAPFGADHYARNPFFLYPKKRILVVRPILRGLGSQIIENQKNIQSFCYRKRIIRRHFDIDLGRCANPEEQALLSAALWYLLAVKHEYLDSVQIGDTQGLANQLLAALATEEAVEISPSQMKATTRLTQSTNRGKLDLVSYYSPNTYTASAIKGSIHSMAKGHRKVWETTLSALAGPITDIFLEGLEQ